MSASYDLSMDRTYFLEIKEVSPLGPPHGEAMNLLASIPVNLPTSSSAQLLNVHVAQKLSFPPPLTSVDKEWKSFGSSGAVSSTCTVVVTSPESETGVRGLIFNRSRCWDL